MPSHHMTEDVTLHFEEMVRKCRVGEENCKPEDAMNFLEHSDLKNFYDKYNSGEITRARDIDETVNNIMETYQSLDFDAPAEIQSAVKLVQERGSEIRSAAKRYVKTVNKFARIKASYNKFRNDFVDQMQEIDAQRRRNHDALIESLRIYNAQVSYLVEEGLVDRNKVHLLDHEIMADRDSVRDWGIVLVLNENLRRIEDYAEDHQDSE